MAKRSVEQPQLPIAKQMKSTCKSELDAEDRDTINTTPELECSEDIFNDEVRGQCNNTYIMDGLEVHCDEQTNGSSQLCRRCKQGRFAR